MTVFPVKHSALLRQPEFLLPRPQLVQLIEKLTDNRSLLPMKAANSYCGWMTGASSIPKAGPAGNGRTASVCTACITTTSRPAMKNAGDYRRLVPSAPGGRHADQKRQYRLPAADAGLSLRRDAQSGAAAGAGALGGMGHV